MWIIILAFTMYYILNCCTVTFIVLLICFIADDFIELFYWILFVVLPCVALGQKERQHKSKIILYVAHKAFSSEWLLDDRKDVALKGICLIILYIASVWSCRRLNSLVLISKIQIKNACISATSTEQLKKKSSAFFGVIW